MPDGKIGKDELLSLVSRAKDGDAGSFGSLYEYYVTPIYRFVYFRIGHQEEAEDVTQTVFLKAWDALPRFEKTGAPFSAWLYAIARNTTIDYWKKKKDIIPKEPDEIFENIKDERANPVEEAEQKEIIALILEAVEILNEDQQTAIIMKFVNDLPNSEIAVLLGKNEAAVRQLQSRGIKKLKEKLEEPKVV